MAIRLQRTQEKYLEILNIYSPRYPTLFGSHPTHLTTFLSTEGSEQSPWMEKELQNTVKEYLFEREEFDAAY